MTENPFQSGLPSSGSDDSVPKKVSTAAIVRHAVRLGIGCGLLIAVPFFLAPQLWILIEEFGIESPKTTQLFMALADKACRSAFLYVPFTVLALLSIEVAVHLQPNRKAKRLVNIFWSLCLFATFVFIAIAALNPIASIISVW